MALGNMPRNSVETHLKRYTEEFSGSMDGVWERFEKLWGRFGRFLYWPYRWLVLAPFTALSTSILAILAVFVSVTLSPNLASRTFARLWARLNSFVTPMWVSVEGRHHIRKGASYVVVANHLSHYDIYLLYGWLGLDIKWVMKKELEKVPFIGWGCKAMGHIFIDRRNREKALETLEAAKGKIKDGTSVIFFPEGTRSGDGSLGEFKKGAFKFAFDLGLPILPITIKGTRDVLPKGTTEVMPGGVSMVIHEPVGVTDYTEEEVGAVINRVRGVIRGELEG
ncbi:MAG: 1-acyl-sn-glycerol-3-phosphate acyltransferase [Desulfobacterales bacterium]|nr:1-acyl-sn-glycerol-3-phosphate acyltransferase [Desulfobacterales bacterium]